MEDKSSFRKSADAPTYLAAERTLLAWVRTGLALMGFGFVVARFGLFLRELAEVRGTVVEDRTSLSLWVGTSLVILGVVTTFFATVGYWRTIRLLDHGRPIRFTPFSLAMFTALSMVLIGLAIAAYLLFGLPEQR